MTPNSVEQAPPFQVERYTDVTPESLAPAGYFAAEAAEYKALGLMTLATRATQHAAAPLTVGRKMTAEELAVWEWRYPSVYSTALMIGFVRSGQIVEAWDRLTWPVPQPVRALIREAWPAFDTLEIWTPEIKIIPRVGPSPILVGVRGADRFLLARWAEALEPFEEIRAKAQSREGRFAMMVRRRMVNGGESAFEGELVLPLGSGALAVALGAAVFVEGMLPGLIFAASGTLLLLFGLRNLRFYLPSSRRWACEYAGWVRTDA